MIGSGRSAVRHLAMGAIFLGASGLAGTASATLNFYTLGAPDFNSDDAANIARQFNLTERKSPTGAPTGIFLMGDGSVRFAFIGGQAHLLPYLEQENLRAPTDTDARALARKFLDANGLLTPNVIFKITEVNTWTRQNADPNGKGSRNNVLKSVRFARFFDGLEVMGPTSRLDVDVSSDGAQGALDTLRNLQLSRLKPILKSDFQVNEEFMMRANEFCGRDWNMRSKRLIYWEQGQKFVQPVYMYEVDFKTPNGFPSSNIILIPAASNSPEVVDDQAGPPENNLQPPIIPDLPRTTGKSFENVIGETAIAPTDFANPVQIGEYIVREDHSCWLDDAKAFWANLTAARSFAFWLPGVNRRDYWWDYPWLWEDALGIPDQSPNYIGKDHYVLIEGHGAPWVITCLRDNAEIIHLNQIKGYGTHQVVGERTAFIEWQSCDVIPEPGHPYEWDFQAPSSAFSVWWQIFKGMRGNYGYRTLMRICNGVSAIHGFRIGLGFPVLSSWLYSTNHGVFGHSSGYDYGSAVIVSGHEGDTLDNNGQLPLPGSLTIWWCHA